MDNIEAVYTAEIDGSITEWRVESRTVKTLKVVARSARVGGWEWRRVVRSADIGARYFVSPRGALEHRCGELEREIGFIQQRLQNKRTHLGMVESVIKRLESP